MLKPGNKAYPVIRPTCLRATCLRVARRQAHRQGSTDNNSDADAERVQIRTFAEPADVSSAGSQQFAQRVVMLSTAWCGVCRQARTWLTQKGVAFTEYDVERTDTGKAEYRRLNGRGVPIILVGDMRMDGFSAARLEAMLAK